MPLPRASSPDCVLCSKGKGKGILLYDTPPNHRPLYWAAAGARLTHRAVRCREHEPDWQWGSGQGVGGRAAAAPSVLPSSGHGEHTAHPAVNLALWVSLVRLLVSHSTSQLCTPPQSFHMLQSKSGNSIVAWGAKLETYHSRAGPCEVPLQWPWWCYKGQRCRLCALTQCMEW